MTDSIVTAQPAQKAEGRVAGPLTPCSLLDPKWIQPVGKPSQPASFRDINLDQVAAVMSAGRQNFQLEDFVWAAPKEIETVLYRQKISTDLEQAVVLATAKAFAASMSEVRDKLATVEKLRYEMQKQAWFLTAAEAYCALVGRLASSLAAAKAKSDGFSNVSRFLSAYMVSEGFVALKQEAEALRKDIADIRYVFHINNGAVSVFRFAEEDDYGREITSTFERFSKSDVAKPKFSIPDFMEMDHVEANILEGVRRLYPEVFGRLQGFFERYRSLIDPTIARLDRELQFYLSYADFIAPMKAAGLPFCYPALDSHNHHVSATRTFDIALAAKLVSKKEAVVTNDFDVRDEEHILVISGPNQGGKTTFARTFGQLHYLGALGLPVPGDAAKLLFFDQLFTHFERQEDMHDLRGKLLDDLVRIHDILEKATDRSIIIMNEIFTSTTLRDALFLGTEVLKKIVDLGSLSICVTFIDELSRLGPQTMSMVSTVEEDDPARRTFKVVRRPADGMAHAMAIAEKYRLTSTALEERLQS